MQADCGNGFAGVGGLRVAAVGPAAGFECVWGKNGPEEMVPQASVCYARKECSSRGKHQRQRTNSDDFFQLTCE